CDRAIAANRASTDARFIRGRIELARVAVPVPGAGEPRRPDLDGAIADFTAAIELGARDYRVLLARGTAYLRKGDPGRAREDLEAVEAVVTSDPVVFDRLAEARAALHDDAGAARSRARAAELRDASRIRNQVADLVQRARASGGTDVNAAVELYRQAIELAPEDGDLYLARSAALVFNPVLAAQDLARAIELKPLLAGTLYEKLFQITSLMNYTKAFELAASPSGGTATASAAADARSETSRAFLRGFLHVLRVESARGLAGDIDRGREEFTTALEDNPTSASAYFLRGLLALRAGDLRSAKEDCTTALILEPRSQIADLVLACVYAQETHADLAFAYLKRAIEAGFKDWAQLRRESALDPLRLDPRWKEILKE
ncbi:MAG TPA: tetratricopeptide repeat protein, partial [Planctomycetota bacterium]|nr:tetratricopeptide repeat protein [Planctomycetota bacterium]